MMQHVTGLVEEPDHLLMAQERLLSGVPRRCEVGSDHADAGEHALPSL